MVDYKSVIESRYNRQNWQLLLHDIFGNKIKFWNTPSTISTSSQFAKQALWLGTITLSDNQTISIYEVELSDSVDIERNRRGIRDMLLTDWRNNGNAGAFMFCYRKNESVLRFSYVSEAWTFADDGSYQKESTDAKRFTYLLGEGHRSRTAIQQFEKLRDSSLTLKDLTKAFSVDAVSDMFFDGYKKQYEDIIQYITGKRMVKVANKWEEQIKNDPCEEIMQEFAHFQNPEKAVRDYVKKLMGRLVFLQFLQKKGWLGVPAAAEWGTGDAEFIQTLFAQCQDKDHFIDNVLESLFNDLNSENEKQLPQYRTPYLNGGLFERDATDETEFPLPAKYMQSLLDFFASYNFTIDENDPDDAEVGVDPEMLGRIFENLLEDNKDKGAFYTPKEIVNYMCRESLIAYLQTGIEDETTKEAIRQFVTTHDVNVLGSNDKFRQQVDEALKNVKICDPAIGSGAFPMGLLKELFQCRTALEGISQHQAAEIKKHIIQQNIYGVDIERGAVDIARLRFWLSLIVDEETPQALPNLDFKIMQGNSLLEQYKGVDLSTITELKTEKHGTYQTTMFDDMIDVLRLDLRKMLEEYYDCTDHHKKQSLRAKIIDNVKQQLREQSINVDFGDIDLSGNNQFMLWHTWFYDVFSQGGFDIVIGNPPYVEFKTLDEQVKKSLSDYKTTKGKYDLYIPFIEQGLKLTAEKAILIYICPTRFMKRDYGTSLRDYIKKYSKLMQLVDFTDHQVFDNAITYTGVFMFCNEKTNAEYTIDVLDPQCFPNRDVIKYSSSILNGSVWLFHNVEETQLLQKMAEGCTSLKSLCKGIYQGIASGKDDVFFITQDIIDEYSLEKDLLHKILKGKDIGPYCINWSGKYVIYPYSKNGKVIPEETLKTNYPQIYSYLLSQKDNLKGRGYFDKSNKLWFELWNQRNLERFTTPKIITLDNASRNSFTYDSENYLGTTTVYSIVPKDGINIKYVLGVLNSTCLNYFHKLKTIPQQGGFYRYQALFIQDLPIPEANSEQQEEISSLVDKKLSARNDLSLKKTEDIEYKIDRLVYQLYGLTEEEIKIIEES